MASPVSSRCEMSATAPASSVTSAADSVTYRMDDPVAASFQLYSLVDQHDRAIEQAQLIESYILSLTEKIVQDASKDGHVGHGLLLLNRKCVAEGVRQVFQRLANRRWQQVQDYYNHIRQNTDADNMSDTNHGESHDHAVMQLARGLSRECCAFQRMC